MYHRPCFYQLIKDRLPNECLLHCSITTVLLTTDRTIPMHFTDQQPRQKCLPCLFFGSFLRDFLWSFIATDEVFEWVACVFPSSFACTSASHSQCVIINYIRFIDAVPCNGRRPTWAAQVAESAHQWWVTILAVFSFAHQPYVPAVLIASMCLLKMHTFRHWPHRTASWHYCPTVSVCASLDYHYSASSLNGPFALHCWMMICVYFTLRPHLLDVDPHTQMPRLSFQLNHEWQFTFLGSRACTLPAESLSQRQHHWTRRGLLMQVLHCRPPPFFSCTVNKVFVLANLHRRKVCSFLFASGASFHLSMLYTFQPQSLLLRLR